MKYCILLLGLISSQISLGQEYRGFLYGTVVLKNNKSYTGQLRWDDESASWDDLFEAYKNEPQLQEQIDIQGYEKNEQSVAEVFELSFMNLWENKDHKSRFAFKCQFGHIDKITDLRDNKYATLHLKSGRKINLRRRGDDIGEDIIMQHPSFGSLEFDWSNIKSIDFFESPKNLRNYYGSKIFGKAITVDGLREGYIVWDFDEEAFERDIINGYHQKVEYDIEFGRITSLSPEQDGALITLTNGTEFFMHNSSDVDDDNDGIFIKTKSQGMINLRWPDMIRIDFTKPTYKALSYDNFMAPKNLEGRVITKKGRTFKGSLAYDLDEVWDIEVLDGKAKDTKYFIPFYLIEEIIPQNYNYSLVKLREGTSLMLGDEGDVSSKNNGVLVWLSATKTKYVSWNDIKAITFTNK
jgi:hypothetical protein